MPRLAMKGPTSERGCWRLVAPCHDRVHARWQAETGVAEPSPVNDPGHPLGHRQDRPLGFPDEVRTTRGTAGQPRHTLDLRGPATESNGDYQLSTLSVDHQTDPLAGVMESYLVNNFRPIEPLSVWGRFRSRDRLHEVTGSQTALRWRPRVDVGHPGSGRRPTVLAHPNANERLAVVDHLINAAPAAVLGTGDVEGVLPNGVGLAVVGSLPGRCDTQFLVRALTDDGG